MTVRYLLLQLLTRRVII